VTKQKIRRAFLPQSYNNAAARYGWPQITRHARLEVNVFSDFPILLVNGGELIHRIR